jgi:hypothetical protein
MKRKVIRVTIRLEGKDDVFTSEGQANQLQSTGLRILCRITNGNGAISPFANIQIYGLAMDKMAKLMRIHWNTLQAVLNTVTIEAGDEGDELSTVYKGNITFAKIDMNGAPNPYLNIESQSAIVDGLRAVEPVSFVGGDIDGAEMIRIIAENYMGYRFENNGASLIIAGGGVYEKTYMQMIQKIAQEANFDLYIEQDLIAICPKGGARQIRIPTISPKNGLVGYPTPDVRGVSFRCFYNPNIQFGGIVKIQDSILEKCNGDWRIYGVTTVLEANQPQGAWFMDINATWRNSTDVAIAR